MSIDLGFQEPRWVAYPPALHTPRSTPSSLSSLPAPCVLDASVLVPSLPWTLDLFCLHSGLSLVHLLTHLSIFQIRLMHDFDFKVGIHFPTELLQMLQAPPRPLLREILLFSAWSQLEPGKPALCPTL